MERLWLMAISEDEGVRKLCLSILLNDDFKDFTKVHLNYQTLDLDKAEPFYLLATEMILNRDKYDMSEFGIAFDEKGSLILHRNIYTIADKKGDVLEDVIDPKFIKK